MTYFFKEISFGMWLTIAGALLALAGQVKVYFENIESEKENKLLTTKISNQTSENNKLLMKNKELNKKLKKINLNQTQLLNDEVYFRNFDFSYAIKDFPEHSAKIFRQTNENRVFSKSISKDSKIYENYKAKLYFEDNNILEVFYEDSRPNANTRQNSVKSSIRIGSDYLGKMQVIRAALVYTDEGYFKSFGYVPGNHKGDVCMFFKLLTYDDYGITYIIGRAKCE